MSMNTAEIVIALTGDNRKIVLLLMDLAQRVAALEAGGGGNGGGGGDPSSGVIEYFASEAPVDVPTDKITVPHLAIDGGNGMYLWTPGAPTWKTILLGDEIPT